MLSVEFIITHFIQLSIKTNLNFSAVAVPDDNFREVKKRKRRKINGIISEKNNDTSGN